MDTYEHILLQPNFLWVYSIKFVLLVCEGCRVMFVVYWA